MNPKLDAILTKLPQRVAQAVSELGDTAINEIRLRSDAPLCVTSEGNNIVIDLIVAPDEIAYTVDKLSMSSLHAHEDTIREGYIIVEGGYRIGVCGSAVRNMGRISTLRDICSLNIRIPAEIRGVGGRLLERIKTSAFRTSVLIYSSPGVGKTTLLRDLAVTLASEYRLRVSVIDSRCELTPPAGTAIDHLAGYPKGKGIEIAVRTLNPQYIICDEIGNDDEAEAILSVQNAGVPFIASAHAGAAVELFHKRNIRRLLEAGVFDLCAGITRAPGRTNYRFTFTDKSEFADFA